MSSFQAIRFIAALVWIFLLAELALSDEQKTAQAGGRLWCKADPIVSLDGRLVDITVSIPLEYLLRVNGPTQIQIKTPAGVDRFVVLNDLGFNLRGSQVTFVDGGAVSDDFIPVEIRVSVPMQLEPGEVAPMQVTVWPDNELPTTVEGTNSMTTVRAQIERSTLLTSITDPILAGSE